MDADEIGLLCRVRWAPGKGINTCPQLGKGKWLDEVVVATGIKSFHPVTDTIHGRQKDDGRINTGGAQAPDNTEPVKTGQTPIRKQQIILV